MFYDKDLFKKISEEVVNTPVKNKITGTVNLSNKENDKGKNNCC